MSADIATEFGVRCYTIGVGTNGETDTPVAQAANGQCIFDYAEVQIDEPLLKASRRKQAANTSVPLTTVPSKTYSHK
jgi:Ca-activated chloride channel family protein